MVRVRGERRTRRCQQDVIVIGGHDRVDRDHRVAAGTVLDHDRLAPTLGEPVGQQPGADVDAAARSKRDDELDRPGRPLLLRGRRRDGRGNGGKRAGGNSQCCEADLMHGFLRMRWAPWPVAARRQPVPPSPLWRAPPRRVHAPDRPGAGAGGGLQQVALPQRALFTRSLSVLRPTAPTTTSAPTT